VLPTVGVGPGTWATHAVAPESALLLSPAGLDAAAAATLAVNPLTALRLLSDFVAIQEGDAVALDAANSAVGRAVLQLASARRLRCVALVRDRPNFDALADELRHLGATEVLRAGSARRVAARASPPACLALNAVGGESAAELASMLAHGGTLVTYGGMSRKPLQLSTGSFIFRDLRARGFWLTQWVRQAPPQVRVRALVRLRAPGGACMPAASSPWAERGRMRAGGGAQRLR
jgi:trans-2-enoyl-CoA reductase